MPLVASLDTVPVTCCVDMHVLHIKESLRVSHTQEAIREKKKKRNQRILHHGYGSKSAEKLQSN